MTRATSAGVRTMPRRLEKDALHIAAATLPRAMAVKAMDDCTVEGSSVRNRMPLAQAGSMPGRCTIPSPIAGNRTKVEARTAR